jgi:hypothetical protein
VEIRDRAWRPRSEVERLKVGGQRLELEFRNVAFQKSAYYEEPDFAKGSVESNWVVDLKFELRIIHVREVAYK